MSGHIVKQRNDFQTVCTSRGRRRKSKFILQVLGGRSMYSMPSVNFASIHQGIHNTLLKILLRSTDILFRTAPPTCRTLPFTMFSSQRTLFRNGPAAGATRRSMDGFHFSRGKFTISPLSRLRVHSWKHSCRVDHGDGGDDGCNSGTRGERHHVMEYLYFVFFFPSLACPAYRKEGEQNRQTSKHRTAHRPKFQTTFPLATHPLFLSFLLELLFCLSHSRLPALMLTLTSSKQQAVRRVYIVRHQRRQA
ncbi:hypothetical protein DFP73DRAFT_292056 [Morchella snyderi]|nr:hypothetical protein DFP73DRAFT_292056 [Morchella snyderi]